MTRNNKVGGLKKRQARQAPQAAAPKPQGIVQPNGQTRVSGTDAQWYATLLYNALDNANKLRKDIARQEQEIVTLRTTNGGLLARCLELENQIQEGRMAALVKDAGVVPGKKMMRDDITGEVYFLEDDKKGEKIKLPDAPKLPDAFDTEAQDDGANEAD